MESIYLPVAHTHTCAHCYLAMSAWNFFDFFVFANSCERETVHCFVCSVVMVNPKQNDAYLSAIMYSYDIPRTLVNVSITFSFHSLRFSLIKIRREREREKENNFLTIDLLGLPHSILELLRDLRKKYHQIIVLEISLSLIYSQLFLTQFLEWTFFSEQLRMQCRWIPACNFDYNGHFAIMYLLIALQCSFKQQYVS